MVLLSPQDTKFTHMVSSSALSPGSSTPKNKGFGLKSSCFMMFAVSMAVTAASEPLFPALPPAAPQTKERRNQSASQQRDHKGGEEGALERMATGWRDAPALSKACSMVSQVRTPNMQGTQVLRPAVSVPFVAAPATES